MDRRWAIGALGLVVLLVASLPSGAIEQLEVEEDISDLLPTKFPGEARPNDTESRPWALLPQFGYGPDSGFLFGAKFAHRDLGAMRLAVDVDGTYAVEEHQNLALSIATPHIYDDRLLFVFRLKYHFDPQRDFFGLGDNKLLDCSGTFSPECLCDPDQPGYPDCPRGGPFSTHAFRDIGGALTIGWRPFERVAFNFAVGLREVQIRRGRRRDEIAFTVDKYPDLPGIEGGIVNPVVASLVWNTRDEVTRPTRGWRVILKVIQANHAFSDFKFTRFIADAGYLRSFDRARYVVGLRVNGEWVESRQAAPFWELTELGGEQTLRGFFPHRFVGKSRILLNGEFRGHISTFDFRRLWHVRIDGVLFGDGGRVFVNRDDLHDEFHLDAEIIERVLQDFQYSYGCGLRIALSEALVAKIDVGFSNEETGLLYLSFGHMF
jgi:outer membrane protein assembly factor BamA